MLVEIKLLHTTVLLCPKFSTENLCTILCALTRLHNNVLCITFFLIFHFTTVFQVL